jgi:hypothetical protein
MRSLASFLREPQLRPACFAGRPVERIFVLFVIFVASWLAFDKGSHKNQ